MAQPKGRAVPVVNGAFAAVVLVVVAAIALVVRPPTPPGIAAFAPQAAKPITKAPPGQSSLTGDGAGTCGAGQLCVNGKPVTTASPQPASAVASPGEGAPSAVQCFRWPDGTVTQTFDPQSPPCIADWPGRAAGNGGATAPGITGTSVRVAFPRSVGQSTFDKLQPLVRFFNTHYQLYGRQIQLVPYDSKQGGKNPDPSLQKADVAAASALNVFASTDYVDNIQQNMTLSTYPDGLARERIVSLVGGVLAPNLSGKAMAAGGPYQWSYLPTLEDLFGSTGDMVCAQLVGRNATHAAGYATTPRKLGLLMLGDRYLGPLTGLPALRQRLAGCGAGDVRLTYYDPDRDSLDPTQLTQTMVQLKSEGVTSLLFLPWYNGPAPGTPQKVAQSVGYQPEWVALGYTDYLTATIGASPDQAASTFGVAAWNKLGQVATEPWGRAYLAAGGDPQVLKQLQGGNLYHNLAVLAAGIQMAGPRLTAQTFAAALTDTDFPNPGAGAAPAYQARVGFAAARRTMVNDFAGFWINPSNTDAFSTIAPIDAYRLFCYVGLGRRWTGASWPRTDGFYRGGCR